MLPYPLRAAKSEGDFSSQLLPLLHLSPFTLRPSANPIWGQWRQSGLCFSPTPRLPPKPDCYSLNSNILQCLLLQSRPGTFPGLGTIKWNMGPLMWCSLKCNTAKPAWTGWPDTGVPPRPSPPVHSAHCSKEDLSEIQTYSGHIPD